jgi:hypothetical protein
MENMEHAELRATTMNRFELNATPHHDRFTVRIRFPAALKLEARVLAPTKTCKRRRKKEGDGKETVKKQNRIAAATSLRSKI